MDIKIYESNLKRISEPSVSNNQFYSDFLSALRQGKIDENILKKIIREVEKKTDCTKCANCCICLKPIVHADEAQRMAQRLGMSKEEFIRRYLSPFDESAFEFKIQPCVLLNYNRCTVYDLRPKTCRQFPYMQGLRDFSTHALINNAQTCLIVYNVLENCRVIFSKEL